jgi:photosystem II stability/assembly factor-like uncharacterized protein
MRTTIRLGLSMVLATAATLTSSSIGFGQGLEDFATLEPRSLGPAGMSGRVAAVAGIPGDQNTFFAGAATGGFWRTDDGGLSWTSLFDEQPVCSIGSIAVRAGHPDEIWVGTGEGNPRNSSSVGNGVFRTRDGGETWEPLGLEGTEKIHRLLLHPTNPQVAWAAALGTTWGESQERGVYRTTDGGETWEQVLFVDEATGACDLILDPANPDKLIAATWTHRRWPYSFHSGGAGSGIWVTLDGGDTWERRGTDEGLPSGDLGRIGLAQCKTTPSVVYALVEAEANVLLRSDNGGRTFVTVNDEPTINPRPFYFCDLRVDPNDANRVYSLHTVITVSDDGGVSFRTLVPWSTVHPDHHAMWIDPTNSKRILNGNDGGIAISNDRGEHWRFARALPLAQYYHVAVDMDTPFNIYGGLQDNGSWRGPSTVWENGGIRSHHWQEVGFGDGFACLPLPGSTTEGYAMSQGGSLMRFNAMTGSRKLIRPDGVEDTKMRYNWNAGIAIDPFDPNGVYYGSQFLHRSGDRGDTWSVVSPDLTTNNPEWQMQSESGGLTPDVTAAENYCSILTIAPSTHERGVVWVGTDDGRLQLTQDAGASWTSMEDRLFDVPRNTWIPHIEASGHEPGRAYVVLDDHRRANWEAYVFRTDDFGATWTRLDTSGVFGYGHVIEEDPVDPNLLFLGTEFGLYVSRDGGASWDKWTHGFPTAPVRDLVVHPRDHDLVIGTHGRAIWVLDDIRPLRNVSDEESAKALHIVDPPATVQYRVKQSTGGTRFNGHEVFEGDVRPRAGLISFFAQLSDEEDAPTEATITIIDMSDTPILRFRHEVTDGLNRVQWNLRHAGPRDVRDLRDPLERPGGPECLPGAYTVEVVFGDASDQAKLLVLADPRVDSTPPGRAARLDAQRAMIALYDRATVQMERIDRVRADAAWIRARLEESRVAGSDPDDEHPHQGLVDALDVLDEAIDAADEHFRTPEGTKGITGVDRVSDQLGVASWRLGSSWDPPSPAFNKAVGRAQVSLEVGEAAVADVLGEPLAAVRETLAAAGFSPLSGPGLDD